MSILDDSLQGYRVLDLSQYLPGPYATRLLADLGADVVKVEPPAGDPMRTFIFQDADSLSPLYKQINAGKTVIRLDLKNRDDCARFAEMVKVADVLLESYRPGVLGRLGFGREQLRTLNPQLIHCAISGFGQDGPANQKAGHDLTYMALSGMLHHTGTTATPVVPFPPVSDYAAGQHAVNMILAALLSRERHGAGCFIDTSLFETILSWQSFGQAEASRPGQQLEPGQGLITGGVACYQIYRTEDDKYVVLGALEEKFWQAFCRAVERPDWLKRQHEPMPQTAFISEVSALFAGATRDTWVNLLAETDCCFEPLLEPDEVRRHPQVVERQLIDFPRDNNSPVDVRLPAVKDGVIPRTRKALCEKTAVSVAACWRQGARSS